MAAFNLLLKLTVMLALAASAAPAQAGEPRAPTGRWVVDFADHQCTATRGYGSDDKPLFLVFKPSPAGDVMQVAVMRDGKSGETRQVAAKLSIDRGTEIDTSLLAFTADKQERRVNLINLPLDLFERVRGAKSLSISASGEIDESFALTGMTALMKAVDVCLGDLKRVWNIGDVHGLRIRDQAKSEKSLVSYFTADDYPGVAMQADQTGRVALALLIDEDGKIADCTVVATSGVAALDAQSCAILTARVKFAPAIGTDGKPVKSSMTWRIFWKLD